MIQIEVNGMPRPGGSKVPGMSKKGKLFVRPANPNTAVWRSEVEVAAKSQYQGPLLTGPIFMTYIFRFPRPKCHYRTGKHSHILRPDAPHWHTGTPDLTKIIRSTEDALTGIAWTDDALVCKRKEKKRYCNSGESPGVTIQIYEMTNGFNPQ
jgi:Holliday junction resolvase RusA-like endonuclease